MKFKVSVEKNMYCTGFITVTDCETLEEAEVLVDDEINNGHIVISDIEWSEPQYEDGTFSTTGDVS